ncbi:uncharacterized protein LOC117118268 [Anneissia japonica]|uniref:uncharacterized protein LOC117118268 n=1 Tax=Anneissia japonica TaxID=1529436 RepID=UPI0014258910|nr:uncharacterized protein LOC117118268 [Anneissia japonica]
MKECSAQISVPLSIIFEKSIGSGKLPKDWKTARIVPVFKKGLRTTAGNYRPVSLTSIPCKIMESLIKDKMWAHLKENNLLSWNQRGFMTGKSCLTNLLESFEIITKELDSGNDVDILYLDYQKAFDSVPHKRLILMLSAYGFDGKLIKWLKNYLCDRTQTVSVKK